MMAEPASPQQTLYRHAFVHNCFVLIVMAREGLTGSFIATEEPTITGLLVKRAKEITEQVDAPLWIEHLVIMDDPPQNDQEHRLGKRRPRIDFEFELVVRGRRPRFHIEAKRLYRNDSATEYWGAEGLGMFLEGAYASSWPSAGMIGYIQTDDSPHWRQTLEAKHRKSKVGSCKHQPSLLPVDWCTEGLSEVRISCHKRTSADLGQIEIYHLLLDFCK